MKKTLIALAVLTVSGASFAQSSVTLDGYMDRGYTVTNSTDNTKDAKAMASSAGTTTVGLKIREDLGAGLSVGAWISTDWGDIGGVSQDAATVTQAGSFANSQNFLDLTGKFGVVRVGTPNNFTLTNAISVASPLFSTGVGSAYSSAFSIANGLGTGVTGSGGIVSQQATITAAANSGTRAIRIANTVQYSSPEMSGFSAHLGFTPKNQSAGTGTDTVGVTEGAVRYKNGPLDAMLTSIKYSVGTTAPLNGSLTANIDSTQNLLGVAYAVLPNLKLNLGVGTFSSSTNAFKGSSQSIGGTYTMGAVDILAQMATVNDKSTTNVDRKMLGLGANYNLSKTTRLYARYDNVNYGDNVVAAVGSKQNRYSLGLSKAF